MRLPVAPPTRYSATTHRDYAQSVRLVTGHPETPRELDWGKPRRQKTDAGVLHGAESGSDHL